VESTPLDEKGWIRARSDIQRVSYGNPFRVRYGGDGFVAARYPVRVDRTADLVVGLLNRTDPRLEPGSEFARFAAHMTGEASSLKEWAGLPFWDACEGVVALWSPASKSVVWMGAQGGLRASISVPIPDAPLQVEDRKRYLERMARLELGPGFEEAGIDFNSLARAYQGQFAELRPLVTDLRCESREVVWLRLFDTSTDPLGRGPDWLRVSSMGSFERFRFPEGFAPMVFHGQSIFGVLEESNGSQALARWSPDSTAAHVF
jgi:hypothetical protein